MDEQEFLSASLDALDFNAGEARKNVDGLSASLLRNADANDRTSNSFNVSASRMSSQITRAFNNLIADGDKLSDVLRNLGLSIADMTFQAAIKPIANQIGGGISGVINGLLGFADGGAFSQGKVMPFARGGVVSSPVTFPMRGGTGLMGEAGPEAIMPLARGADGKLGVRSGGGGGRAVNVVMNIQTPDAAGFQRSQSQIAAQMSRALARGQRNR